MSVFYIAIAALLGLLTIGIAHAYQRRMDKLRDHAFFYAGTVIRLAREIERGCPPDPFVKRWVMDAKASAEAYLVRYGRH